MKEVMIFNTIFMLLLGIPWKMSGFINFVIKMLLIGGGLINGFYVLKLLGYIIKGA